MTPEKAVVRISIGHFPEDQLEKIEELFEGQFKDAILPAVKRLSGNLAYYVAIDRENLAITNTSIWESREAAEQMATMKEMLEMRDVFLPLGVPFTPITHHEVVWSLPD